MFTQNIISQESCHFCLLPKQTTNKLQIIWYLKIRSSNIPKFAYQKWDKYIYFQKKKPSWNPSSWCTKTYPQPPPKTKGPRHPSLPGLPWTTPNPNVQSSAKTGRALRKPCKPHWRLRNLQGISLRRQFLAGNIRIEATQFRRMHWRNEDCGRGNAEPEPKRR